MTNRRFDSTFGTIQALTLFAGFALIFSGLMHASFVTLLGLGVLTAGLVLSLSTTQSTLKPAPPVEPKVQRGKRGHPRKDFYLIHHHRVHHVH